MTLQKYLTNYQEQVVLPTPSKNRVKEINFHEMNFAQIYLWKCKFGYILRRFIFTNVKNLNDFAQTYFDGSRTYNTFVQYVNGGVRTNFCKTAVDQNCCRCTELN